MAVGTVTLQPADQDQQTTPTVMGGLRVAVANVQPTSGANYTTGGSAITAAKLGLQRVVWGTTSVITAAANGPVSAAVVPQSDGSVKLKCNVAAAEVGANVDLSGALVQVVAYGE